MTARARPAVGSIHIGGTRKELRCARRVIVQFDDETFAELRSRALAQGTSFATQVRQLVEIGLETERGVS